MGYGSNIANELAQHLATYASARLMNMIQNQLLDEMYLYDQQYYSLCAGVSTAIAQTTERTLT